MEPTQTRAEPFICTKSRNWSRTLGVMVSIVGSIWLAGVIAGCTKNLDLHVRNNLQDKVRVEVLYTNYKGQAVKALAMEVGGNQCVFARGAIPPGGPLRVRILGSFRTVIGEFEMTDTEQRLRTHDNVLSIEVPKFAATSNQVGSPTKSG